MNHFIKLCIIFVMLISYSTLLSQEISPYIKVGDLDSNIEKTESKVVNALKSNGFDIIGQYAVAQDKNLKVIVFSRKDLQTISLQVKDRGALASALKVGLKSNGSKTIVSYLNPEYLFQAYLMDAYDEHKDGLVKIQKDVASTLSPLGNENKGFGGSMSAKDLRKYHYKIMMPYFTDPIELKTFGSFDEGVKTITKNLETQKGKTKMVYSLTFTDEKTAVFGIALQDTEAGEKHFLPIIGDSHLAAMPYEIILQDRKATMLHGRYRLALHWPELTMGTFMKIRSTPGYVEDTFEELCE